MNNELRPLTEQERLKKEKQLNAYKKIKEKGFWKHTLTMSFGIALGLSILNIFKKPIVISLITFLAILIFGIIFFTATWYDIDKEMDHLTKELELNRKLKKIRKTNPIHLVIFFILLTLIIAPLFFKKELLKNIIKKLKKAKFLLF